MRKLVEVVPNFSEGRDRAVIDAICAAIEAVDGVTLLDVDPGAGTNRTVVTLVGPPDAAVEAAFAAIAEAQQRIDMRRHRGAHPRMGATDVCPFVPISGVSMDECAELARRLGRRVGDELGIPVYLYEHAASREALRNLAQARAGEYEGLASRDYADPAWAPDFGPAAFVPRCGATAIGAREFLIAYNVNLNTRDARIAREIALDIREKGRWARDEQGKLARDADGNKVQRPGRFQSCKAVGWYIEEYGQAQVTVNLTDPKVTAMHDVFDAVREGAAARGARVTGSEAVGLVPLDAMRAAGRHYLVSQGKSPGLPDADLVRVARVSLGLDDVAPFEPRDKIVEWRVAEPRPLVDGTAAEFCDRLSADTPVPGGGSTAALCGALSAALSAMVANLTAGRPACEAELGAAMGALAVRAQALKAVLLSAVEQDSAAYDTVIAARRLKGKSEADKAAKAAAVQTATREAIRVPLVVLEAAPELLALAEDAIERGMQSSLSDAGVAGLTALTAARGAYVNLRINLPDLGDGAEREALRGRADTALAEAERRAEQVWRRVLQGLE